VLLDGDSICTSGDYTQLDAHTAFHHMYTTTTGSGGMVVPMKSTEVASVTLQVEGGSCAWCDGLTTAAFLLQDEDKIVDLIARAAKRKEASGGRPELLKCVRALVVRRPQAGENSQFMIKELVLSTEKEEVSVMRPMASAGEEEEERRGQVPHRRLLQTGAAAPLRRLTLALPKLVCVAFAHVSKNKFFGATFFGASVVFTSSDSCVFYLQRNSFIADVLVHNDTVTESGNDACGVVSIGVLGS